MSRQVLAGEAAKDVRDLDHDHDRPRQRPVINVSRMPLSETRVGSVRWV